MKTAFLFGYFFVVILIAWSVLQGNIEFFVYGIIAAILLAFLQFLDKKYTISSPILWGFNIWLLLHTFGGLMSVWDGVLYSKMIFQIVWEPYNILKYDQIVHFYCYFIITLILWSVIRHFVKDSQSFLLFSVFTVLASIWIGGLNEIIEFLATVFIEEVNVWGYENTAIDIICNTLWALSASLLFKTMK